MLYQERYSSAYLSQAQSSLVQWGLDGKLRTILDTIIALLPLGYPDEETIPDKNRKCLDEIVTWK